MRRWRGPAVMGALMLGAVPARAADPVPVPRLVPPGKVVSLHRPKEDWKVVTTIILGIEPTTEPYKRKFRWSAPLHGQVLCNDQPVIEHETPYTSGITSIACTYQPQVGFVGNDKFTYDSQFENGAFAPQAVVDIEVRDRGLRWEFKTAGATITSDHPDPEALSQIPSVIGGTTQDFLLSVNWQLLRPRRGMTDAALAQQPGLLRASQLDTRPSNASRSANFVVETGVETEPVASNVDEIADGGSGSPRSPATAASDETAVARRTAVLRGEVNYNAALNADGVGRFAEVGGILRGSLTTVLGADESFKEVAGSIFKTFPKDRGSARIDSGVRFVLKQSHETNTTTLVTPDGQVERPTNVENALTLEALWRFDTTASAQAVDVAGGDPRQRWVIRAEFSPEIAGVAGHQLPLIGVEVSRAWKGGPPMWRVTYGVNLSASKGIFKS